jgi:hypothetical protein
MKEFSLEKLEEINGGISFFKLIHNGRCYLDEFFESLPGKDRGKKNKIFQRMNYVSLGKKMPSAIINVIRGAGNELQCRAR